MLVLNVPTLLPNWVETTGPVVQVNCVMAPPPCDTEKAHDWMLTVPLFRSVSEITTLRATLGPMLSTKMVYVKMSPARTVPSGSTNLETRRSARSFTMSVSLAQLLDRSGSLSTPVSVMHARLMTGSSPTGEPATKPGSTTNAIWNDIELRAAMSSPLQVTSL